MSERSSGTRGRRTMSTVPIQFFNGSLDGAFATYNTVTEEPADAAADDQEGAMLFIVVTVCVYSLGIVAFIASHLYKKRETKLQDMQISDYLASVHSHTLARIERMDTIRNVQYKLPEEYRHLITQKVYWESIWTPLGNGKTPV